MSTFVSAYTYVSCCPARHRDPIIKLWPRFSASQDRAVHAVKGQLLEQVCRCSIQPAELKIQSERNLARPVIARRGKRVGPMVLIWSVSAQTTRPIQFRFSRQTCLDGPTTTTSSSTTLPCPDDMPASSASLAVWLS